LKKKVKIISIPIEKKCSKCGIVKPNDEFYKDQRGHTGLYSCCKKCHSKARIEKRRVKNKIHRTPTPKSYFKILAKRATKPLQEENRPLTEKHKAALRRYAKKRRSTPQGKLNHSISTAICQSLRGHVWMVVGRYDLDIGTT